MKKLFNICYWIFTVALGLCGVFFLALIYIPAEYVAPVLAKMHISYEWCIGLTATSFATFCIFVATRFVYSAVIRHYQNQAIRANNEVKESRAEMQIMREAFAQFNALQNETNNRLKQLEITNSAILDMEKQTARERLAGGLMASKNRAELEKSLQNVIEKEQEVAELKATAVVYEQTVEKVVEEEKTQQNPNDGLI